MQSKRNNVTQRGLLILAAGTAGLMLAGSGFGQRSGANIFGGRLKKRPAKNRAPSR